MSLEYSDLEGGSAGFGNGVRTNLRRVRFCFGLFGFSNLFVCSLEMEHHSTDTSLLPPLWIHLSGGLCLCLLLPGGQHASA